MGQLSFSLTMDSQSLSAIHAVTQEQIQNHPHNQHGEADYAV